MKHLLASLALLAAAVAAAQPLTLVDQDYPAARRLAAAEDKLLLIDFYTTWCTPCKELDAWVFRNDTAARRIARDYVVLRYDAEDDKVHHLSKKHHVNTYPSAVVLDGGGYVVSRKYGFPGDDTTATVASVYGFCDSAKARVGRGEILPGYANTIDAAAYPDFYADWVNRDDTDAHERPAFDAFWTEDRDPFSEVYFTVAAYFPFYLPEHVGDHFTEHRGEYERRYGETDVDLVLFFLAATKFDAANEARDQALFDEAAAYAREVLAADVAENFIEQASGRFAEALEE